MRQTKGHSLHILSYIAVPCNTSEILHPFDTRFKIVELSLTQSRRLT